MARILVDARTGWGSGIGRYVAATLPRLAELRPHHRFDIVVPKANADAVRALFVRQPDIGIVPSDVTPFTASEQWALEPLAAGYDLTWFTNYFVPLRWRQPFVATVHDMLHLTPALFPTSPAKRLLSRLAFAKVRQHARGIAFVSRFSQREFERLIGVPRRAVVCGGGIDHPGWLGFDPDAPPRKRRRILVVGAAKQHKNFAMALSAWQQARLPEGWLFTAVVPGVEQRSGIDISALIGTQKPVDLRRGISDDALHALYGEAAVVLMPSLYEGFGLPLLEGMQAGALCIASTAEALVEVAGGGWIRFVNGNDLTGWTEAIEQACRMIDTPPFDLDALRRHSMRHAACHSWTRTANVMADLIDEVA